MGFLSEANLFRQLVVYLITWKWFDRFVLALIITNSAVLAMTDYSKMDPSTGALLVEDSVRNTIVEALDPIFTSLFMVEGVLKIIAMGLFFAKGAYLRDPWNWLDFVVAVSGYVLFFNIFY